MDPGRGHSYTMESSVAAMDATPAVHVAAASNFCPVPPAILIDGEIGMTGLRGVKKPPSDSTKHCSFEDEARVCN